jgi:Nucleoside-diphosphate-sugar epimerases
MGTLNLVTALRDAGCDAFVQAGTSSEYGLNCAGPDESASLEPNSDYAVSKVATSYLMSYYGRLENFPCTHLRIYSVYGLGRNVIVSCRPDQLGLQGSYPPLVDPHISRDFIYVDDCTRAFVRAALTTCRSAPGQIFNIATGSKTSLGEIALLVRASLVYRKSQSSGRCRIAGGISRIGLAILAWLMKSWAGPTDTA